MIITRLTYVVLVGFNYCYFTNSISLHLVFQLTGGWQRPVASITGRTFHDDQEEDPHAPTSIFPLLPIILDNT